MIRAKKPPTLAFLKKSKGNHHKKQGFFSSRNPSNPWKRQEIGTKKARETKKNKELEQNKDWRVRVALAAGKIPAIAPCDCNVSTAPFLPASQFTVCTPSIWVVQMDFADRAAGRGSCELRAKKPHFFSHLRTPPWKSQAACPWREQ